MVGRLLVCRITAFFHPGQKSCLSRVVSHTCDPLHRVGVPHLTMATPRTAGHGAQFMQPLLSWDELPPPAGPASMAEDRAFYFLLVAHQKARGGGSRMQTGRSWLALTRVCSASHGRLQVTIASRKVLGSRTRSQARGHHSWLHTDV